VPIHEIAVGEAEAPRTPHSLDDLVYELKREVRRAFAEGRRGIAVELLAQHPDLRRRRMHVFDVLYEEYQLLTAAEEEFDLEALAGEFAWFPYELNGKFKEVLDGRTLIEDSLGRVAAPWPEPGDRLGGFEIVDLLGAGAAAHVYLAKEPALGDRLVAIKASPRKTSEAETLGKLLHPNIVPVHSVTSDGPTRLTLVCMPFLGRATLDDVRGRLFRAPNRQDAKAPQSGGIVAEFVKRGAGFQPAIPPRRGQAILDAISRVNEAHGNLKVAGCALSEAGTGIREAGEPGARPDPLLATRSYVDGVVHLAAQMADALAYTHSSGICHGDLKPANVLVSPAGRPMLLDFNLANEANGIDLEVGGTLVYMPPERLLAAATSRELVGDPRSDLFSLGAIVYQLLCGELPFGCLPDGPLNRDMARWMWERQRTRPLPLGDRNVDVDPSLARLVERCLEYDPADRPQSARELATEFRRHLAAGRRAKRWVRTHPWLATAAAVVMIVALGVATHRVVNAPTPAEYAFDQGIDAYRHADYATANQRLTESLDYGGKKWQTWYLRGLARQHLGDHGSALDDYRGAEQLHPTRAVYARMGDCFCRAPTQNFPSAIAAFRRAIERGEARPEVYNNLGVCFQIQSDFSDARNCFDCAIVLAPHLATPYYNRAFVEWKLAFRDQRPASADGLRDIDQAVALGLSSSDVLLYAARMHSYGVDDTERRRKALAFLAKAIEHGAKIELLNQDPTLRSLMAEFRTRPDYPNLVATGAKCAAIPTNRLLDLPDDLNVAELAER